MIIRQKVHITGVVQGVGFRPTVYQYAKKHSLTGYVNNSSQGVIIEIQGEQESVSRFLSELKQSPPKVSQIDQFNISNIDLSSESDFAIISSKSSGDKNVLISPDLSTCKSCMQDLMSATNRRHQYAFTNCTDCGPRFSIIKDRPYDRPFTSMSNFELCAECLTEYQNPESRRFHAQPNACPTCGPELSLLNTIGDPLQKAVELIKQGKIVAIKGLGGFNICADASNEYAIQNLRIRKKRATKSFAIMVKDIEQVKRICELNNVEEEHLTSLAAPIVLLKKRDNSLNLLSPDNNYLGVMLPYTPLHHMLMQHFDALVMTSANNRNEPIAITNDEVRQMYQNNFIIDEALLHNREIVHRADDSIIQIIKGEVQFIRRSRGYVPLPSLSPLKDTKSYLALGANMKNTFALSKSNNVFISQHIGELIDYRNFQYQQKEIEGFEQLLNISTVETICDRHPQYENFNRNYTQVYHHHAHFLSVLAENDLLGEEILGVIADGTGYGTDETIWGFEFLKQSTNDNGFSRLASLKKFPLIGSEKAIAEIDRIGITLDSMSNRYSKNRVQAIEKIRKSGINSVMTSSLGRLFDGVASLLGLCQLADYEAQGAILLQKEAENAQPTDSRYCCKVLTNDLLEIDYSELLNEINEDLKNNIMVGIVALKFHYWIVDSILEVAKKLDMNKIACSGGCFQNKLLTEILLTESNKENITVYLNHKVPTNDAGISYGQIIYAQLKGATQCV